MSEKHSRKRRSRSLSASLEEAEGNPDQFSTLEEMESLRGQVMKLEADKKNLQGKVSELMAAGVEVKEKADLLAAEKRARQHVSPEQLLQSTVQ